MRRFFADLTLVAFSVAALSIAAAPARAQIPPEVLKDIKAATVFVKVRTNEGPSSGSGFLMQVDKDSALIVTNEHVIAGTKVPGRNAVIPPKSIEVVFDSGRKTERVFPATVLAADDDRDLAVLQIKNAKDLPQPLNISGKVDVIETMTIYIVGFPFGTMLSTNKGNPALTIGKGTVSSIREDDKGEAKYVQIDGDINPGNSGGPVVDAKGRLVGVSVAKLVGTNIGLAIPPSELTKMLNGSHGPVVLRMGKIDEKTAEINIELQLIDPLHKIHKASVRVIAADELKSPPTRDKGGNFQPLPNSKIVDLKVDNQKGIASFTVRSDGERDRKFLFQPVYVRGDKVTVHAAPTEPFLVRFTTSAVAKVTPTTPGNSGAKIESPSKATRQGPLGPTPQPIADIKIVDLQRGAGVPCLCWSKDGKSFYHLGGLAVRRISVPDGEEKAILKLDRNCTWLCLSSQGVVLTMDVPNEMWLLDPETLRVVVKVPVGQVRRIAAAPGSKFAYYSNASSRPAMLNVLDLQSRKVVQQYPFSDFGNERMGFEQPVMTPDGNYLFAVGGIEQVHRFRTSGTKVTFEESSPRLLQGAKSEICVSTDSKYVGAPSGGGNYSVPGQAGGYSTFLYSIRSFEKVDLAIPQGAYPRALGLDVKSGLIYAQNHNLPLMIFDVFGAKLKDVPLKLGGRNDSEVNQFLVHPQGRKLIVGSAARLWYVELPTATSKVADASGTARVEPPTVSKVPESDPTPRVEPPATNKPPAAAPNPVEPPVASKPAEVPATPAPTPVEPPVASKPAEVPAAPPRVEPPLPSKPADVTPAPQAPPPVVDKSPEPPAAPRVEPPIIRKWTDDSGTFSVDAALIEVKNDRAYLRSTDGKKLSIPLDKLSAADRRFVKENADKKPTQP